MKDLQLSNRIEESLEMLQALSDEGLIVVPAIPTETMVSAAKKISNLSEKEIRKIYFTMTSFADEEVPISTN